MNPVSAGHHSLPEGGDDVPPLSPEVSDDTVPSTSSGGIVLSLCDGMGGAALSLKEADKPISRYIALEKDTTARKVCQTANPKSDVFPGVGAWA